MKDGKLSVTRIIVTWVVASLVLMFVPPLVPVGFELSTGMSLLAGAGVAGVIIALQFGVGLLLPGRGPGLAKGFNGFVVSVGSLAFGLFVIGAAVNLRSDQVPYPDGIVTTATLTDKVTSATRSGNGTVTQATYTYTAPDGSKLSFVDHQSVDEDAQIGSMTTVSYRPADPAEIRIVRGWHGWTLMTLVLLGLGCIGPVSVVLGVIRWLARPSRDTAALTS